MEITIKLNDYAKPTECRQEVVQAICDAFLDGNAWSEFIPYSEGAYRPETLMVIARNGSYYGFANKPFDGETGIKVRGCEMQQAFQCLIKGGYHILMYYKFGSWKTYRVSKKPYHDIHRDAIEVFEFNDNID